MSEMIDSIVQKQIEKIEVACKRITPKVAIRCITFNHEAYIKDALDSFIMQKTNYPFIAIVHDDASTDGTAKILSEYAEKYPDIIFPIFETENQYSKKDGSLGKIMNAAIAASGVEYVAMCEGDDYWTNPDKLQIQTDFLDKNPDYGMTYTKTRYYYDSQKKLAKHTFGGPYTQLYDLLSKPYCIPTATILLKSNLLFSAYNKHINKNNWLMGDFPLSLSVALDSKIHFINQQSAIYRVLESSACHFSNIENEKKFLNSVLDVKRYYSKAGNLRGIEEIAVQYNNKYLWKKSIVYNDFQNAKIYRKTFVPNGILEKIMKMLCNNKISFSLLNMILKFKMRMR